MPQAKFEDFTISQVSRSNTTRKEKLIKFVLSIAIYVLLFSNLEVVGIVVQFISIALLALTALFSTSGRIRVGRLSLFEIAVYFCSFVSLPAAMFVSGRYYPDSTLNVVLYSVLTFMVISFIGVICASININHVMNSSSRAYVAMLVTILLFNYQDFLDALTPGALNHWALRARAFNLHPNLEGLIFAGGFLILLRQATLSRGIAKIIYFIFSIISCIVVMGASARASLLAMILSFTLMLAISFPKLPRKYKQLIFFISIIGLIGAFIFGGAIWNYVYDILELGSSTRGLDSGGSGRTELWQKGIALFASSLPQSVFGGGLRWSTADVIGFSVESSYITIFLDSGILAGGFLIISILFSLFRSASWALRRRNSRLQDVTITTLILFSMFQGLFNRYLFAIGNPFSLIMLFIFTYASRGQSITSPDD